MASTSSPSTGPLDANVTESEFKDILPQPLLAGALAPHPSSVPYHVFINHRGPDVKTTLATDIFQRLTRGGLRVFLDAKVLELGASIPREIEDAIHSASVHIVIFSPHYAESPWCLEELSIMLKTRTRTSSNIIPVFYNVDPSVLRWVAQDKGVYAQAISDHEGKRRYSPEKIQDWKTALSNVSLLYGGDKLENNEGEEILVERIVNSVLKSMKKKDPLKVAQHRVGLDEMVQEVETKLETFHDEQNVKIVGIFGMGGSGKTTLAKEIYNRKCSFCDRSSFVFDVRDAARNKTLQNLQKKLAKDLLRDSFNEDLSFDNITEGEKNLRSCLRGLRVLVVLDDIDHVDQIDALLPSKDMFQPGTLIMITTREVGVLNSRGISCTYKMRGLHLSHAKELFCWHAFLQSDQLQGFEDLAEKFVKACDGLPLSLKVLGAELYNNSNKNYWVSLLAKISRIVPPDIQQILKVSFDALDPEEQDIFQDTACFFMGEEKDLAVQVWDGLRLSGLHSWEKISNKCLVELDQENRIRMHDHLRDMGREIARTKLPYRFFPFSNMEQATLWRTMETCLSANRFCLPIYGGMPIRGIMEATIDHGRMAPTATNYRSLLKECMELFSSLIALRLLVVVRNDLTQEFATLTKDLVWLRWFDFEHRNLPQWISARNLRVLELFGARHLEELWEENVQQPPLELRMLRIWNGCSFQRFPKSIGRLGYLKKLCLHAESCPIRELPEEFCDLSSLERLELRGCSELSSLPGHFGDLTNLQHLNLESCRRLRMLPVSFKELINLEHIELHGCENLTFTKENSDILGNMRKLEHLGFAFCRKLLELPGQATNQPSLRELYLFGTSLRELPSSMGQLEKLEVLTIGSMFLTRLPTSLGYLFSLKKLKIMGCHKIKYLPDSLGNLYCLKSLSISDCPELKSLTDSMGQLSNLEFLHIMGVPIENLSFGSGSASSLREIYLYSTRVSKISISDECCPSLEILDLFHNKWLVEIETLPRMLKCVSLFSSKRLKNMTGIERLPTLLILSIRYCQELAEHPSFADWASIKEIKIKDVPYANKIEGLEHLRSVEVFEVSSRWDVRGITNLKHTERLRKLELFAENISAVEPCIQNLENWPSEMTICGRVTCDVESLGNALVVPGLTLVEAFRRGIIPMERLSYVTL